MSLIKLSRSRHPFKISFLWEYSTVDEALSLLGSPTLSMLIGDDHLYLDEMTTTFFGTDEPVSTNDCLAWCFESLLVSHIFNDTPDSRIIRLMEQYMRRYEIDKRLQKYYEINKFTPVCTYEINREGYVMFSGALLLCYHTTDDLRFLNTLYKLKHGSLKARKNAQKIVEAL